MITLATLLPHIDGAGDAISLASPALTREEAMQAARDEAAAAASAAAEVCFAVRLEQIAARQAEELQAARQRWSEEEAGAMAERLVTELAEAEHRLANAITAVLAPFVGALLPVATVKALEDLLLPAIEADLGVSISLHGPEDLVKQLATRLAEKGAGNISVGSRKTPELQAECNDVQVVTRLTEWCDVMRGAVHG